MPIPPKKPVGLLARAGTFIRMNALRSAAALVSAVVAIISGLWAFDAHYAKAADLVEVKSQMSVGQHDLALQIQIGLNKQSIRDIQSKIDDIDALVDAHKDTAVDRGRKLRLSRELQDLQEETKQLQAEQFQLENQK